MTAAEEALQRAIAEACLGASAGEAIARDLRGYLERHGVPTEDVEAILAAPARLAVYRSLVRNGLSSVVARMLPRTRARMNAACGGRFDADLAAFVDQAGPRTHYLRDFPAELFAWAEPRWRADASVPAYLPDLAAHELAQFAVAAAPSAGAPTALAEAALDRPLAFTPSMRLVRYAWAVHELPAEEEATGVPARRDVRLLAYRDPGHEVRWLELTPLAAAVLERLAAGQALGPAVQAACAEHGVAPPAVLADVARLLADLGERGVLLGARP
ncbi:MAG TPA: PqqD family peptide modification chaperone [Polyangiaceae bacterium]